MNEIQKLIEIYENLDGLSHTKIRELLREVIEMKTNLEPIKVTLFEKSILECAVNHGYEWIARNKNGVLWFSKRKPIRDYYDGGSSDWYGDIEAEKTKLFSNKLQFIKWENNEPTHIPTLLKEAKIKGERKSYGIKRYNCRNDKS